MEPPAENKRLIHLDIDQIHQIALTGVRRAALFLGIGLNAVQTPDFKDYELRKLVRHEQDGEVMQVTYGLIPDGATDETLSHYKEEFGNWVINNCLRDLVETFALYLDHIHAAALLIAGITGKKLPDHENLQRSFHLHPGLGWKLRVLQDRFGIDIEKPHLLGSLYDARNCLSHRLGVVASEKDCGADGKLHIKWVGVDLKLVGKESGKEGPIIVGQRLKEESALVMSHSERTLTFNKGERIEIPHESLQEVCHFCTITARELINSLVAYARNMGVKVNEKPMVSTVNEPLG